MKSNILENKFRKEMVKFSIASIAFNSIIHNRECFVPANKHRGVMYQQQVWVKGVSIFFIYILPVTTGWVKGISSFLYRFYPCLLFVS